MTSNMETVSCGNFKLHTVGYAILGKRCDEHLNVTFYSSMLSNCSSLPYSISKVWLICGTALLRLSKTGTSRASSQASSGVLLLRPLAAPFAPAHRPSQFSIFLFPLFTAKGTDSFGAQVFHVKDRLPIHELSLFFHLLLESAGATSLASTRCHPSTTSHADSHF